MENQEEKNKELVKRGYKAFNEADINTLNDLFHENCIWSTPGKSYLAGDHVGKEAVFKQFAHYGADTGGIFKADLKHVLSCGHDKVVGLHHNTGERNGKKLDVWCCLYFTIKDGKVINGKEHFYDLYAWDEFWS